MLFTQVKLLAYCIFAAIVVCQSTPDVYVIRNHQVSSDVLAASLDSDARVIIISLENDSDNSDNSTHWDILFESSGNSTIKNTLVDKFLSVEDNNIIFSESPYLWYFQRQDEGFLYITTEDSSSYLTLDLNSNPHSVILVPSDESDISQWEITPFPGS